MNPDDELYQLCTYLVKCTNVFFRTVREHGIWLRGSVCTTVRTAGDEMHVAWWFVSLFLSLRIYPLELGYVWYCVLHISKD